MTPLLKQLYVSYYSYCHDKKQFKGGKVYLNYSLSSIMAGKTCWREREVGFIDLLSPVTLTAAGAHAHGWWERRRAQPLWKTIWCDFCCLLVVRNFSLFWLIFTELRMQIPCHLGTPLPYIQQEICSQNLMCVYYRIFIVTVSLKQFSPRWGYRNMHNRPSECLTTVV